MTESRPPFPPFTLETAKQKVQAAENAWNTRDPARVAKAYIEQLNKSKYFPRPIVTEVAPLRGFYMAEAYHQDYAFLHPNDLYIRYNDAPKIERFKTVLPDLFRVDPSRVTK